MNCPACRLLVLFGFFSLIPFSLPQEAGTVQNAAVQPVVAAQPLNPEDMRAMAVAFLGSLDNEQLSETQFEFSDMDARTRWSNLPSIFYERGGLRAGDMTVTQRHHLHDLIRASTSSQGYLKIAGVMWLDDVLSEAAAERGASGRMAELIESWTTENYWVSVFGNPETDEQWGWLLTGHHLSASFTIVGDNVAFTPLFLGAEPYIVESGPYAGWRILSHERERGFRLMQTLTNGQRAIAVLGEAVPNDIFEGPGQRNRLESIEGIQASALDEAQQVLLWELIEEYVRNADHRAANAQLAKIRSDGLEALSFAWIGPTEHMERRYYYRVHGPSVLIEYVRERGVGGDENGSNHIHTIVRDPSNDYGEDWLETHYEEHHR
ncbi:MAG: DUF3500 domain-containing protein [Bacteroidota bacterium]|nr:DUF3500 domain-containing protein [Bacteroidota bacterium]